MADILPIRQPRETAPDRKFAFTSMRLERYACPVGESRVWLKDANCPDLRLQVTSAGSKTFYVYRKLHGRPVKVCIGPFPTVSIDTARKRAKELVGEMIQGNDPRTAKREAKQGLRFAELFDDWLESHAKLHKKTWREDERQYNQHLLTWRRKLLAEITREHVAALHAKVGREHGRTSANRLVALMATVFAFGERERGYSVGNPAKGVRKFTESKRTRFLQPAELPAFFQAVEQCPSDTIRDFVLLLLWTGARKSNLASARWEQIDLDSALWHIPMTKSGKAQTIPLVPQAVEILTRRQAAADSDYIFPGRGSAHLVSPTKAFRAICTRAGLDGLRLHDLRRSLASWMTAGGTSLQVVGKALGHSRTAVTEVYSHLAIGPIRDALNKAAASITDAGKGGAK